MQVKARVIGYIPLEGQRRAKTRMSMLLDAARAKSDGDRLKKLAAAAKAFDHSATANHDADIKSGAGAVLCSVLRSCSSVFAAKPKEVQLCLTILLQLYRCSDERLRASFCTDGCALVLDLLELIEINYRLGRKGDAKSLVLAQRVLNKLIGVARVPLEMVNRHDELLSSLVGNINGVTGRFAMHSSFQLVATMAEHTQNKRAMLAFPGLMDSVETGSKHMSTEVRDEAARIIRNVALDDKIKAQLIQGSGQHWLDILLAHLRGSPTSTAYAIQTLGCLATLPENKIVLTQHKYGAVIDALIGVASSRTAHSQTRINAARVLASLTCRATAVDVGSHPGLLVALSSLACCHHKPATLAVAAAMTIKKVATYVRPGDRCYEQLLQSLVTMSYSSATGVLAWAVKAYHEQASHSASRLSMIGHKGLLSSLNALSKAKNDFVRDTAQEVLSALASDVADAKNVGVENVIRYASKLSEHDASKRPRVYSPTSVFDFEATFC
ncbi:hypothetical protein ACHAXT_007020 [Thalassiosira profunda]